jgi:uncharacterized Zn finger protein (UPF0148 family)
MGVICENCGCELVAVKGGYNCPKCESFYSIDKKMIWDGINHKEVKRYGNS